MFEAIKDPSSVVDYTIDWSATLAEESPADTISTSSWTADHGLTVDSDTNTASTATVWVSGGTKGKYASLVNQIVTAGGRTLERTITVQIQET